MQAGQDNRGGHPLSSALPCPASPFVFSSQGTKFTMSISKAPSTALMKSHMGPLGVGLGPPRGLGPFHFRGWEVGAKAAGGAFAGDKGGGRTPVAEASVLPPVGCPRKDREQMAGPHWPRIPDHSGKAQGDGCRCSIAKMDMVERSGHTFELNGMSKTWNLTVWKEGKY